MVPKSFSTISRNSTTFPFPVQSNKVSSTKISTSSSNVESLDFHNEEVEYAELNQEDDDKEEKIDSALNDIISDYSNLLFEDYIKLLIIHNYGRCSSKTL